MSEWLPMSMATAKALVQHHEGEAAIWKRRICDGCGSCIQFQNLTRHCRKWNATVPADKVQDACAEWEFDDIPF